MEFRILGPVEVADNGRVLSLGSGRQLALVGLLLLHRNQVVSNEQLVDELWGGSAPPTAGKIVRNYVSLLRKELGERLVTRPPGYLLRVEPGEIDVERLESAIEDGSLERLTEALALWRGAPLTQLAYESFAQREIARLEELRLTAIEARIEAELKLGREGNLVSELEALVRAHPLREREQGGSPTAISRPPRGANRRRLAQEPGAPRPGSGSPSAGVGARIVAQIPVGASPTRLALAGGSVWVLNSADRTVSRIDTASSIVLRTISVPGPADAIAADEHGAWVVYVRSGSALGTGSAGAAFVDARFNDVTQTVVLNRLFEGGDAIAIGADSVWAADRGFVTRIDPTTGKVLAVVPVGSTGYSGVAVGDGAVWAIGFPGVVRIDPAMNTVVTSIPVAQNASGGGPSPTAITLGDGALWVANRFVPPQGVSPSSKRGTVTRIDPAMNAVVATIPVGHDPFGIAFGAGAIWVANRTDFTVSRIDPRSNRVVATIRIGNRPQGIAAGGDAVWVSVG
jgi:YVTN family beta-propeller protein